MVDIVGVVPKVIIGVVGMKIRIGRCCGVVGVIDIIHGIVGACCRITAVGIIVVVVIVVVAGHSKSEIRHDVVIISFVRKSQLVASIDLNGRRDFRKGR